MSIKFISPKKSVNSAFLKLPVPVEKMEDFKLSLKNLYSKRNPVQDEEYHKGEIWNFLRKIFEPDYSVQVNRPIDLAIFNGNTASAKPAVIIEAKSPTNAAEMFSAEHPNVKSLQELVYYFMLEYVHSGNHEIKWLAITNFDEWYFFDVKDFIRYFGNKSKPIYDQFLKFKANQMSGNKTSDFYNEIAKPAIDDFLASCDINVVHFNLEDACKNVIAQAHDRIGSAMKHASGSAALASHVIASEAKQSNAACHPERTLEPKAIGEVEGSLLKALLAIFNSKLCKLWIWHNCPELGDDRREIRKAYFENLRIPLDNAELLQQLATLADEIITAKKQASCHPERSASEVEGSSVALQKQIADLETQANTLVYQLYGVTDVEEIEAVEKR